MSDENNGICGWTKLWHPRGPQVTLPVPMPIREWDAGGRLIPLEVHQTKTMLDYVTAALDAGWLAEAPGLEAGEQKETYHHVVRGVINDTAHIDFYREEDKYRHLGVYLNRDEDVAAFERACGVKLDSLCEYVGSGHIERGKGKQTDALVSRLPKPVVVVWKPNPKHDPNTEEGKKKPARLFVRWFDQSAPNQTEAPNVTKEQVEELQGLLDALNAAGAPIRYLSQFYAWAANSSTATGLADIPKGRFQTVKDDLGDKWRKAKDQEELPV